MQEGRFFLYIRLWNTVCKFTCSGVAIVRCGVVVLKWMCTPMTVQSCVEALELPFLFFQEWVVLVTRRLSLVSWMWCRIYSQKNSIFIPKLGTYHRKWIGFTAISKSLKQSVKGTNQRLSASLTLDRKGKESCWSEILQSSEISQTETTLLKNI